MSRVTAKPTYCVCDQHGFRPACASAQSDQDPCCSLTNSITRRETDISNSMDPDQTARMRRLVWIYACGKPIMQVLPWRGSYVFPLSPCCRLKKYFIRQFFFLVVVWFYGAPSQLRLYGAKGRKMVLAYTGDYNVKATAGVKTSLPAGAKRCIDSSNSNPFSSILRSRRDNRWL
jgi:hypothetical protein